MSKIALGMIVKDDSEAMILNRCLTPIAPYVDGIYLTFTNTPHKILEAVANQFNAVTSFYQWDKSFERARNFNFSQIPDEYEYVLWLDSDDVIARPEKIPDLLKVMDSQKLTALYCDYNYEIDPKSGKVNIVHPRERILKNKYYEWKGHLHETLIPLREQNNAYVKDIVINHFPTPENAEKGLYRNLEILEMAYKEEGKNHDPRTEFYLARNLFDVEQLERAEKLFLDYVAHSGWDEEIAEAYNYLGIISLRKNDYMTAKGHFLKSIEVHPQTPTWYVNLAYCYALMEKYDEATHYARLFVATPMEKTARVSVPIDDEMRYYHTIYLIAMSKRKITEAREALEALLKRVPADEDSLKKLKGIKRLEDLVEVTKAVEVLINEYQESDEARKIPALLSCLPSAIESNAYIEKLRKDHLPPRVWEKGTIVYYAGKTFEEWNPDSLTDGLGGSETAIVQLGKEWVKLGYKVTVFGNPGAKEGVFDGVEYLNYYRFNHLDTFDTLILWRSPWDLDTSFKATKIYLDLHDVPNPHEFTKERLARVDKIFVKSKYHRSLLPGVPDEKFAIIPNGVDKSLLNVGKVKRNPFKIIYSSSYDRGLEQMLTQWNIVKEQHPQAELHIYYGWNMFDAVYRNNPERQNWKERMIKLMSQDGVTDHGRVGQEELIKAKAESSIHWYGATFEEIDCISIRESAAVGCVPVTTHYAVFKEKPYVWSFKGSPFEVSTHRMLANKIASSLNTSLLEKDRERITELAKRETWEYVAKEWSQYV